MPRHQENENPILCVPLMETQAAENPSISRNLETFLSKKISWFS